MLGKRMLSAADLHLLSVTCGETLMLAKGLWRRRHGLNAAERAVATAVALAAMGDGAAEPLSQRAPRPTTPGCWSIIERAGQRGRPHRLMLSSSKLLRVQHVQHIEHVHLGDGSGCGE
jgi:hypothetical protein